MPLLSLKLKIQKPLWHELMGAWPPSLAPLNPELSLENVDWSALWLVGLSFATRQTGIVFHPSYIFLYWLSMSQKKWGTNKSDPAKSAFFQGVGWNSYLLVIWAFIAAVIRNPCSSLAGLKSLKTHKQIEPFPGDWGSHWWSRIYIDDLFGLMTCQLRPPWNVHNFPVFLFTQQR